VSGLTRYTDHQPSSIDRSSVVRQLRIPFSVLATVLIWLLAVQVATNIRIDAAEATGTVADRAAFYTIFFVGALLASRHRLRLVRWRAVVACGIFFLYMLGVVFFTTDSALLPYIVPNYGVVSWTLLGAATNVAVGAVATRLASGTAKTRWRLMMWLPVVVLAAPFAALQEYAADPGRVQSYQFPAANLIVLMLFGLLAMDSWQAASSKGRRKLPRALPPLAFLFIGTVLCYFVSRMNSTAIVGVWTLLAAVLIWRFGIAEGWRMTAVFCLVLAFAVDLMGSSRLAEEFFAETRFGQLQTGGSLLELSSVATRADLLPTFGKQFAVSPFFGHMEAEVVAGFGKGNYVHSLPLSALTHTGVMGAVLLLVVVYFLLVPMRAAGHRRFAVILFSLIAICGSAFAFFTWIPFWYMVGYLSVNAHHRESVNHFSR
jgi:hypothetical protein